MSIDVPTLAVLAALIGLELAVGFALTGWMLGRQPGLRKWIASAVCITSGGAIWMALRGSIPEVPLHLVVNALFYAGMSVGWMGTMDFCGRERSRTWVWLGLLPFISWILFFSAVVPSPRMRTVGFSIVFLFWSLAIAWTFFRHAPKDLKVSTGITGGLCLLYGLFSVVRISFPHEGQLGEALLVPGWPRITTAVATVVFSIALTLSLVSLLTHRLMNELRQTARIDPLTKVRNRRALEADGAQAAGLCRVQNLPCAVLLLDLDQFKKVNDTHGHAAGDAALVHVAALLTAELRGADVFGRYGGEEFVVIMPGAGPVAAAQAAERIRSLVANHPTPFGDLQLPLTASIGVASAEGGNIDLERLLSLADAALYRAKEGGRDRVLEAAG